jgi:hypothetical protein
MNPQLWSSDVGHAQSMNFHRTTGCTGGGQCAAQRAQEKRRKPMVSDLMESLSMRHFIRGFSISEVRLVTDALLNSVVLNVDDWRSAKRLLIHGVSDAAHLEGLAQKWNVDWSALKAKLESLEDWQSVALCAWVAGQRDSEHVYE